MALNFVYFVISLVVLCYGAQFALDSSEKVGRCFGMSPLTIGLLIVGLGTSLPELFVSHLACLRGEPGIALGNIMGSNVANIFLILGVSLLVTPLSFGSAGLLFQTLIHVIITLLLAGIVFLRPSIGLMEGAAFLIVMSVYLFKNVRSQAPGEDSGPREKVRPKDWLLLLLGFSFLYGSGELLVYSVKNLGSEFGLSAYAISAFLVALGTSLPELVTSIMSLVKGKDKDLIIGNILGSNIFNIGVVLGTTSIYGIPFGGQSYSQEILFLLAASFSFVLFTSFKLSLNCFFGLLFLGIYIFQVVNWMSL